MNKISLFFFLLVSLAFGQKAERSQLILPPKQIVQINYPLYQGFNVKIWNKSKFDLGVSAREQKTDSLVKGFGLDSGSSAVLEVNKGLYLQFENRYLAPLKAGIHLTKRSGREKEIYKTPYTATRVLFGKQHSAKHSLANSWGDES
jgi:hypothetical protein